MGPASISPDISRDQRLINLQYIFLNIVEYQELFQMKLVSFKKCLHCKQKIADAHLYLSEILINIYGTLFLIDLGISFHISPCYNEQAKRHNLRL